MDGEKINELISYLADMEFKGEQFESEIRRNIRRGLPSFSVRNKMDYEHEQMFYDLRFRRDHQFDAYRLENYKATHRNPIEINHKIINGIDTKELEARMKGIDWTAHFRRSEKYPENPKDAAISKVVSDLLELDTNQNFDGIEIQELLQLKYFPENVFDDRLKELRSIYDRRREFTATESGICNAHLAYHILSGRLDDLYEKLQGLELHQCSGLDVYTKLEMFLSDNPDAFELRSFSNKPEGFGEYVVPVTKIEDGYSIDKYTVTLTPYPPIEHGVYDGIDTGKLESLMCRIDWHNDRELFIMRGEEEPGLQPKVQEIHQQMDRLNRHTAGSRIADQLQIKYWADASFFEGIVQQTAWDHLDSLPKRVQQFPIEVSTKTAFNLLCGKATMNAAILQHATKNDAWIKLDLSHKEDGNYPVISIEGFPKTELEKQLDLLPIDNMNFHSVINALKRGDLLAVRLNDDRKVMLQANPEQKTIDIFTPDMRPIPVNLSLDPDWKSSIFQKENVPEVRHKMPPEAKQNIFSKQSRKHHRRGRRI